MKRRKTGQSFAALRNRLTDLISVYVRFSHADVQGFVQCVTCWARGHWKTFDCGHFLAGRSVSMANLIDERGQHPQCRYCNRVLGGNQTSYYMYMKRRYGMSTINNLVDNRNKILKLSSAQLTERISLYRARIKALKEVRELTPNPVIETKLQFGDFPGPAAIISSQGGYP